MDERDADLELWFAPTSPFARKVRVAAAELGLAHRLRLVRVDPWTDDRLRARNPLAKVPTLVTAGGDTLFESGVICDYLDSLAPKRQLFPEEGLPRWRALRLQGAADGAMLAMGRLFAEERKPPDQRHKPMMARFVDSREAVLDWLAPIDFASDSVTIGELSVAMLLGYLDFRWPERDWRSTRILLARWFDRFSDRRAFQETAHNS